MNRIILTALPILALAACGGGDSTGKSTTKLDAVEVQPGSISDSMIILDDVAGDGTAVDNSVPDDGTKKDAAKADDESAEEDAAEGDDETANPDAVPAPEAKKSLSAETATKKGE
ncbi:hypothetical protein [Sphingopyxis sp. H115]|uniref:hypothetical protein n=1 Tax=Sphingopyxis sp. H115 TaxID=1759073 RepID=UPI0007361A52|nr:hypothetical protein [Sphingopyxis sp. H115]KTE10772.1 hypothetical protein ATE71_12255 [Sphingopyxis sp. H115]